MSHLGFRYSENFLPVVGVLVEYSLKYRISVGKCARIILTWALTGQGSRKSMIDFLENSIE